RVDQRVLAACRSVLSCAYHSGEPPRAGGGRPPWAIHGLCPRVFRCAVTRPRSRELVGATQDRPRAPVATSHVHRIRHPVRLLLGIPAGSDRPSALRTGGTTYVLRPNCLPYSGHPAFRLPPL